MYNCAHCEYTTNKLGNWNKHIVTKKHVFNTGASVPRHYKCELCGRSYKYQSGLSKHKQTVHNKPEMQTPKEVNIPDAQLQELCKLLKTTITKNQENFDKLLPNMGTHVTNNINEMTINVFLNDYCKDAMNMSDFLNKINFTVDDLNYTNANGYLKGITNIFVKNLSELPITERPIHCSDRKKLEFYVKDENSWSVEASNKERIQKSFDTLSKKQVAAIKMWEDKYPNWTEDETLMAEYINLVKTVTSIDPNEIDNFCKDISNKVYWDKKQIDYN